VQYVKVAYKFQHKLWANRDLTVQPVITDIYSCERRYTSCLLHPSPYNGPETELKCKIGLEPIQYLHFIIYRVGAESLFVLIYPVRVHTECVCVWAALFMNTHISVTTSFFAGVGRGESQVHSKKILTQSMPSQTEFL
jgi:hypothetical protein